jgi:hypothetical protein
MPSTMIMKMQLVSSSHSARPHEVVLRRGRALLLLLLVCTPWCCFWWWWSMLVGSTDTRLLWARGGGCSLSIAHNSRA